jgi:hypothetical protein
MMLQGPHECIATLSPALAKTYPTVGIYPHPTAPPG